MECSQATFVGYEERVADRSFVLGAQITTTARVPIVEDGTAGEYDASHLEPFYEGLKLRLGYWPALVFNDPALKTTDWQQSFEESSGDNSDLASLVHCLLEVNSV